MRTHIALFSQTGTEIVNISKELGRLPDVIITNERPEDKRQIHLELKDKVLGLPNTPSTEDYEAVFSRYENPLITLHGWLRIIPPEICQKYEILNGHPGDIVTFPELKGKDPQKRAYELGLKYSGAVIHKVTPEVDDGEVIKHDFVHIEGLSLTEIFHTLHSVSTRLWVELLSELKEENKWF
jgi:phosphoribosylglycinamide formyltransferase-1